MTEEPFEESVEVQTEYERGRQDGIAYLRGLADDVMARTIADELEIEALKARIVDLKRRLGGELIHFPQPSYGQDGITEPWEPISEEMQKGLELAAYICRMYKDGEQWADAILSPGEQIRGRWWMECKDKL